MNEPDKRTPWICANCGAVFGDEQGAAIVSGFRASNAELVAALQWISSANVGVSDAEYRVLAMQFARGALREAGAP